MTSRRTHRSYVSYIDKSREYYAAHGYEGAYQWASNDNAPFTRLQKPLSECRVGLLTTVYFPRGNEPDGLPPTPPKRPYAAPIAAAADCTYTRDLAWAKDETHTDDVDSYLPVNRLVELAESGLIGSLSPRFYGVPTDYSQRRTISDDAPVLANWLVEDDVDIALLVPL